MCTGYHNGVIVYPVHLYNCVVPGTESVIFILNFEKNDQALC